MDFASILSSVLSYGIVVGAFILKVPQIINILKAGNAEGLTLSMFALETVGFSIAFAYNFLNEYPLMTYAENAVILIQVYVIVALMLFYNKQLGNPVYLGGIAVYFAVFISLLTGFFPPVVIDYLQSSNILVTIGSRVPQILANHQNKSVGQLSTVTCFLNFGGSAARVFTTYSETGDLLLTAQFALSSFLNLVMLLQCVVLGSGSKPPRKVD